MFSLQSRGSALCLCVSSKASSTASITHKFLITSLKTSQMSEKESNASFSMMAALTTPHGTHCALLCLDTPLLRPWVFWHSDSQEFIYNHPLVKSKLIKPLKKWPASSPDLNIIENLMGAVKRKVEVRLAKWLAKCPKGTKRTEELYNRHLVRVWNTVSQKTLENLYDSLPRRCKEVIERKGEPLKNWRWKWLSRWMVSVWCQNTLLSIPGYSYCTWSELKSFDSAILQINI